MSRDQSRVVDDVVSCRTAARGGRLLRCDDCGHETSVYNSCRNRHCPTCLSFQSARWVQGRVADLLPIPYFHLVFTVPPTLHPFFLRQPRHAYRLLFAAAAHAITAVCRRSLGATPGLVAVLHTWTQRLHLHPHVHCIVTGGGISLDGQHWVASRPRFFLPVRKLSRVFRGKLLDDLSATSSGAASRSLLRQAASTPWVVYSKAPLGGPEQVIRYLGRYTHRIAIGNERIVGLEQGRVTFTWRDRPHGNQRRSETIPADEFVQRFLLHVVPHGFVRIRHYGLLANAFKSRRLRQARALLGDTSSPAAEQRRVSENWVDLFKRLTGRDPLACPRCPHGTLRVAADIPASDPTIRAP